MTILALDVGFANTGWAVFDTAQCDEGAGFNEVVIDVGCITTSRAPKKRKVRLADENALRGALIASTVRDIVEMYGCIGIIGEMPSGGAKSASAMRDMAAATVAVSAAAAILRLPTDWCSPADVKRAACGIATATKIEIMDAVADFYKWEVKRTMASNGVCRSKYIVQCQTCGRTFPGGKFEHVADAIAAYWALRHSNVVNFARQSGSGVTPHKYKRTYCLVRS